MESRKRATIRYTVVQDEAIYTRRVSLISIECLKVSQIRDHRRQDSGILLTTK